MRSLHMLGITLLTTQFALFACATAQDQQALGGGGATSGDSGAGNSPAGVSGSQNGTPGTGGTANTGAGGTTPTGASGTGSAFGGATGIPTGGGGNAGSVSIGGNGSSGASSAGSGGSGTAGAGGKASGGASSGGAGGKAAGGASSGGSGGAPSGCLVGWQTTQCDTCSTQTQGDLKACASVLQCYEDNACTPSTCGQFDGKCGQNTLQMGTAAYPIALQVYNCRCM